MLINSGFWGSSYISDIKGDSSKLSLGPRRAGEGERSSDWNDNEFNSMSLPDFFKSLTYGG